MTIPTALPPGFVTYGRTREFTPDNLPDALKAAHSTKPGTWALLHVLEGKVRYQLEPPGVGERLASAGETIVIEAEVAHRVAFAAPGRFFVEFYRKDDAP